MGPYVKATCENTKAGRIVTYIDKDGYAEARSGGSRSWRNNNPGNLQYTPFSLRHGAIGSDGTFAIFPDETTGQKAREALLSGESYADKPIIEAIKKYAPAENKNDPARYAKRVGSAAGVDVEKQKMADLTDEQKKKLLDTMKSEEGWLPGTVKTSEDNTHPALFSAQAQDQ